MPCRLVKPEDATALARISVAAWQAAYRGLMPHEFLEALGFQRDSSERSTSGLIGSPLHELRYRMAFEPAA